MPPPLLNSQERRALLGRLELVNFVIGRFRN
jgi:hypothetical protein